MKRILPIIFLFIAGHSFSQDKPQRPQNVIVTFDKISGNSDPSTFIEVDTTDDSVDNVDYTIIVNYKGYFEQKFNPPLQPSVVGTSRKIIVKSVDEAGLKSDTLHPVVKKSELILEELKFGKIKFPSSSINPELDGAQPPSTSYTYDVKMVNTNFTIPIVRFNLNQEKGPKEGDIILFNSVGAGIGMSWGELTKTTDANGETINTDYTNFIGVHLGVLFSAGGDSTENKNIFAPTLSLSGLDFQVGVGYEMGTVLASQSKFFLTVAYAIPLSKLLKGKYFVIKSSKGYNSKNPLIQESKKYKDGKEVKEGKGKKSLYRFI